MSESGVSRNWIHEWNIPQKLTRVPGCVRTMEWILTLTQKQYKQFFIRLPLYLMQALLSKGVWRVRWWCFEHSIPWTKKKNSQQRFTGWVDQSRCLFSHGVQQWAVEKSLCLTVCNCGGQANNLHQWIDDSDVNDLFPHECTIWNEMSPG